MLRRDLSDGPRLSFDPGNFDVVRVQPTAGVPPGKIVRPGVWWGTPVQPLGEYKRQNAHIKGLERLKADVKELKRKLAQLTDGQDE